MLVRVIYVQIRQFLCLLLSDWFCLHFTSGRGASLVTAPVAIGIVGTQGLVLHEIDDGIVGIGIGIVQIDELDVDIDRVPFVASGWIRLQTEVGTIRANLLGTVFLGI